MVRTTIASRALPGNSQTRMQKLLDEGDQRFFADHPGETRRRFYFLHERMDDHGKATRYILVECDGDSRLLRRFERDGGQA